MAGANTYLESDGKAVDVDLTSTVGKNQVAVVAGWLGVSQASGDSGDTVALAVDDREYQFTVPDTLDVSKGDIVYVEVADLTGHIPDDAAYGTTAGAGLIAFFKATMDKDANNVVTGIMIAKNALLT